APQKESASLTPGQEAISEMPTESVNTGHWRTVPPVVTGQSPVVISGKIPSILASVLQEGKVSSTPGQAAISDTSTVPPLPPREIAFSSKQEEHTSAASELQSGKFNASGEIIYL